MIRLSSSDLYKLFVHMPAIQSIKIGDRDYACPKLPWLLNDYSKAYHSLLFALARLLHEFHGTHAVSAFAAAFCEAKCAGKRRDVLSNFQFDKTNVAIP